MVIYFIVREDDDIYIEPRSTPIHNEDVEVDGKEIVAYKLTQQEADEFIKNRVTV